MSTWPTRARIILLLDAVTLVLVIFALGWIFGPCDATALAARR
jgi:hypothetical protein